MDLVPAAGVTLGMQLSSACDASSWTEWVLHCQLLQFYPSHRGRKSVYTENQLLGRLGKIEVSEELSTGWLKQDCGSQPMCLVPAAGGAVSVFSPNCGWVGGPMCAFAGKLQVG